MSLEKMEAALLDLSTLCNGWDGADAVPPGAAIERTRRFQIGRASCRERV